MMNLFLLPRALLAVLITPLVLAVGPNGWNTSTPVISSPTTDISALQTSATAVHPTIVSPATASRATTTQASSPLPTTGFGSAYASLCASAFSSWYSVTSSFSQHNGTTSLYTQSFGGTSYSQVIFYKNATTLCDGHARAAYSPAIPTSSSFSTEWSPVTQTSVYTEVVYYKFPSASPTCSIAVADCDPLWSSYNSALAAQPTSPPVITPPCVNSSQASINSVFSTSMYGCGPCTIFGNGVQLVYFPPGPTVTRDMCASTPTATLTSYNQGALITAYAGLNYSDPNPPPPGMPTAVANGHTFTSGTAYISIDTVYAEDRCFTTKGVPLSNVILALPSSSVLSLRYSQNHFQYFWISTTQTGYPVSYADFREPVPWSAWNGQNFCEGPFGGWQCSVIYDGQYRPQLAIPPEIRSMQPAWHNCQLWFNGFWDPPLALTPGESIAPPTLPHGYPGATPTTPAVTTAPVDTHATTAAVQPSLQPGAGNPTLPVQSVGPTPAQTGQSGAGGGSESSGGGSENGGAACGNDSSNRGNGNDGGSSVGSGTANGGSNSGGAGSDSNSNSHGSGNNGNNGGSGGSITSGGSGGQAGGSGSSGSSDRGAGNGNGNTSGDDSHGGSNGNGDHGDPTFTGSPEWTSTFVVADATYTATGLTNSHVVFQGTTLAPGQPARTLANGMTASINPFGALVLQKNAGVQFQPLSNTESSGPEGDGDDSSMHEIAVITISGRVESVTKDPPSATPATGDGAEGAGSDPSAAAGAVYLDGTTLLPGGAARTYADGEAVSVARDGSVVVQWASTIGHAAISGTSPVAGSEGLSSTNIPSTSPSTTRVAASRSTTPPPGSPGPASTRSSAGTTSAAVRVPASTPCLVLYAAVLILLLAFG